MNRPQPLLLASTVTGLITSAAAVLATLGYVAPAAKLSAGATAISGVAVGLIVLLSHLAAALAVHGKVTPVAAPMNNKGEHLQPAFSALTFLPASTANTFIQMAAQVAEDAQAVEPSVAEVIDLFKGTPPPPTITPLPSGAVLLGSQPSPTLATAATTDTGVTPLA